MDVFVEFLVSTVARPLLGAVLALFGYDLDWERKDGHHNGEWRLVLSAVFCCAVSAIVLGGLIWLVWLFAR